MNNDGKIRDEEADGLDARADVALWNLLGQSPQPGAGPYFSRRVLREVALQADAQLASRWWQPAHLWRACRRLPALAFVTGTPVAALLLVFLGFHLNTGGGGNGLVNVPPPVETSAPAPAGAASAELPLESVAASGPAAAPAASVAAAALPEGVSEQDVEVIAELDTLLNREQNHLWTEDTARF